jgi:hypothetical protein
LANRSDDTKQRAEQPDHRSLRFRLEAEQYRDTIERDCRDGRWLSHKAVSEMLRLGR